MVKERSKSGDQSHLLLEVQLVLGVIKVRSGVALQYAYNKYELFDMVGWNCMLSKKDSAFGNDLGTSSLGARDYTSVNRKHLTEIRSSPEFAQARKFKKISRVRSLNRK